LAESGELIENRYIDNRVTKANLALFTVLCSLFTQPALSAKYEKSSKFWKTFTLIAVPAAAIVSGGLV
jgi:hypothetical protein